MCFDGQWHCNAHSNNVIVISERQAVSRVAEGMVVEPPLCACVDFDMAFTAGSSVDMQRGMVGSTPEVFERLLQRERLNFCEVLAGGDSTSGVPQVAMAAVADQPIPILAVQNVMHDTLVHAFLRAFDAPQAIDHAAPYDPLLHKGCYALVRMSIIVMAECLA